MYLDDIYVLLRFGIVRGAGFWRDVCYLARGKPLSASNLEQNFPTPDFPEQPFLAFIFLEMGVNVGAASKLYIETNQMIPLVDRF